jgi:hypothetical protein
VEIVAGFVFVLLGMSLFIMGLEQGLFPLGKTMAKELTDISFLAKMSSPPYDWSSYYWIYIFAFAIGFSTAIAEPSLIAVALKAEEISSGTISAYGLRIAVAVGAATGVALGCFRIVTGTPLYYYIITGYIVLVIQSYFAPKQIIPLAFDSGGVTTSTVTVPLVTALGLGLSVAVEGRSPLLDGFGLIAFTCLFPIFTVMAYAQTSTWIVERKNEVRHNT